MGGVDSDRGELVPILRDLERDMPDAHWLIAGSADTGILATLATALRDQTESITNDYRVTVTDSCRTPLILCEEYGRRHGLKIKTHTGDLFDLPYANKFDGLLLHSLFSFVPDDTRESLLRIMKRSLKPGGKLVFCSRYGQGVRSAAEAEVHAEDHINRFAQAFLAKDFSPPEEEATFFQRTRRCTAGFPSSMPGSFDSVEEMIELLQTCGFKVESVVHSGSAVLQGPLAEKNRPKRVILTANRIAL